MSDSDMSQELPHYLTRETSTLIHLDSETSLIVSTSWSLNEVVSEEDQMPLDIPVDLPIEVAVQAADELKESHLSDYTKRLFEKFDPCCIRVLRERNIRRGFEKEGMELQRPERIYDVPDTFVAASARRSSPGASGGGGGPNTRPVSPRRRPRLATPTSLSQNSAYSQAYQPLAKQTQQLTPKPQYAEPEPQEQQREQDHSPSPTPSTRDRQSPDTAYSKAYQPLMETTPKPKYAEPDKKKSPPPRGLAPASGGGAGQKMILPPRANTELTSSTSSGSLGGGERREERGREGEREGGRVSPQPAPSTKSDRDVELLDTRVEVLEREVYALRAEIAKLKTQGLPIIIHLCC